MLNFTTSTITINVTTKSINEIACLLVKPESEFPNDLFTLEQRQNGAVILHVLVAIYIISNLFDHFKNLKFF